MNTKTTMITKYKQCGSQIAATRRNPNQFDFAIFVVFVLIVMAAGPVTAAVAPMRR